ncbi:Centrosomal protein of 128 kDa, partial [Tinamus guttatus]
STRVALDHLESLPGKLNLLEDFKDIGVRKMEVIEEQYMKYKEIVSSLQRQLEVSKRRVQQLKDVKIDAEISDMQVAAPSSSWRTQSSFLSSTLLSDS